MIRSILVFIPLCLCITGCIDLIGYSIAVDKETSARKAKCSKQLYESSLQGVFFETPMKYIQLNSNTTVGLSCSTDYFELSGRNLVTKQELQFVHSGTKVCKPAFSYMFKVCEPVTFYPIEQ